MTLKQHLASLESLKGRLSRSEETLLEALRLRTRILGEYEKLDAYLYLSWARNMKDSMLLEREQHLSADVEARLSFMAGEIASIPEDRLTTLKRNAPSLSDYAFVLARSRRLAPHRASSETEATLAALAPELSGWQDSLYEEILSRTTFEPVNLGDVRLDPHRDRARLLSNPSGSIREQGFKHLYAGLE
ncbi:MAG TPA: hypothetical protein VGR38_11005, partial [Candidatus Polarisedimenticolia bacterium]|nr:hypothetical protein [Candidatus Polarisedimenticolia bacterium]